MPRTKASSPAPSVVVATIDAAALALGVDQRTVKAWFAAGCPHERGKYDLDVIRAWRAENRSAKDEVGGGRRRKWTARKIRAEALRAEDELAVSRGQLVPVDVPAREFSRHITEARALLEQLPNRFLSFLPSVSAATKKHVRQKVAACVHDVLTALEHSLRKQADDE